MVNYSLMIIFVALLIYHTIMSKVFIKKDNESYVLVDKESGELKKLVETFVVDEELWMKLYVGTYFTAIGKIKSATEMKIFAACLLFAEKTDDNGCVIMPSKSSFRNALQKDCNISQQNLHRALKHLCDFGLLQKITRFEYRINPQIAYLGDKRSRAELILKIVKE